MTAHIISMLRQRDGSSGPTGALEAEPTVPEGPNLLQLRPRGHRRDGAPERLGGRPAGRRDADPDPLRLRDALRRHAAGEPLGALAEELGIALPTLRRWREKTRGLRPADADRLLALEQENARLRRQVEQLRLDNYMLEQLLNSSS